MTENITVMTWNTNGDTGISTSRIEEQKEFLDDHHQDTDLFLLQAVRHDGTNSSGDNHFEELKRYFEERGCAVADTRDWERELLSSTVQPYCDINAPFKRCKMTTSQWDLDRKPLDLKNRGNRKPVRLNYFYVNFLTGPFVCDVYLPGQETTDEEGLEVWNTGIIHGSGWKEEKINALETVYARINLQNEKTDKKVILGGDFNSPYKELNEQDSEGDEHEIIPFDPEDVLTNYPFYGHPYYYNESGEEPEKFTFAQRWRNAERYVFDPDFGDWDMSDAYRATDEWESSTEDHTHVVHNGNPPNRRLDHVLVDDHFDVISCEIQNGEGGTADGFDASDHAPVKAELELG